MLPFPFLPQAHGHTALHMAAGLHGNPHQTEILQLLLSRGADPSIRNLENDQPAHLLQSGLQGEQVSCPFGLAVFQFLSSVNSASSLIYLLFLAQAHAEETKCFLSPTYRVLTGPRMI